MQLLCTFQTVFLVPSNALISQQRELLEQYMPRQFNVKEIRSEGGERAPVVLTILNAHVCVLTYQLFLLAAASVMLRREHYHVIEIVELNQSYFSL